jgi:tRNA G26 N,N-dimethylase Trm1
MRAIDAGHQRLVLCDSLCGRIKMAQKNLFEKLFSKLQQEGLLAILNIVLERFSYKLQRMSYDPIGKRRDDLSKKIMKLFDSTVRYGPFRGLRLISDRGEGSDRAAIFLYEQEVLNSLKTVPPKYKTFIDLGSADGYYGVGVLVNKMFEKTYCFEMNEKGREVIKKNAALNEVADNVVIRGTANKDFHKEFSQSDLDQAVLLIDIEGGEFDLLDKTSFERLSKSIIIIELHDWVDYAQEKIQAQG